MTDSTSSSTTLTITQKIKRFLLKSTLSLLLLVIVISAVYIAAAYYFTYSDGQSVGVVQKLSKKGWVCKTWEGEQLRLTSKIIAVPEKFIFSVRDEKIAEQINASLGKEVVLHYEQHRGLPSCFGDTEYFVANVTISP